MASFHVIAGPNSTPVHPVVYKIGPADLKRALTKGVEDFLSMPSSLVFLALIYPIIGICLAGYAIQLLFPAMAGFALVGPIAAIGLYEMSRRRELGLPLSWIYAFRIWRSPSIPAIVALGVLLLMIFILWLASAEALYGSLFGPAAPESYAAFFKEVFATPHGWALIVLGNAIGLIFAVIVFSISVVSFPLLLDHDVGLAVAVQTSVAAVLANPRAMALWGLMIALLLALGFLMLFVGLAIVLPILAHSSWHLYRSVVDMPARTQSP